MKDLKRAKISVGASFVKHFQKYEHSVELEIYFLDEEDYDIQVKYWQAKCRKLVKTEMMKDEMKAKIGGKLK